MKDYEQLLTDELEKLDIYPFRVIFTKEYDCLVSLTFYTKLDLQDLLEKIKYSSICDKSGYEVYDDTNTLIIRSSAVVGFFNKLFNERKN